MQTPISQPNGQITLSSQRTNALSQRLAWLLLAAIILLGTMILSLALGAQSLPLATLKQALITDCQTPSCLIISDARLPRTLIGLLVGVALGLAGLIMQTLTRNPLADPGILGVNAGASAAVVLAIAFFGTISISHYLWFAFAGALIATLLVALIGALTANTLNPVRLTLAGIALGAVLEGVSSGIALLNPVVFDQLRFWQAGSLDIQNMAIVHTVFPPILLGSLIALSLAKPLNSLSMGNEVAVALGTSLVRIQILGLLAITLLCGSATAAVGPIAFIGLIVPHIARYFAGSSLLWLLPWTLLLTPTLLLWADIIGRFLVSGELRVSIVSALMGAPILILLVRRSAIFRKMR